MPNLDFFIFGMPRSGTTLFSNIINSHERFTCLVEPFAGLKFHNSFQHLDNEFNVNPVEYLKDFKVKSNNFVGLKETFRNPWVANHIKNKDLIKELIGDTDQAFCVLRDVRAVWISSVNAWNDKRKKIEIYARCWNNSIEVAEKFGCEIVKYEDLVFETEKIYSIIANSFKLNEFNIDQIESRNIRIGDKKAHKSKDINKSSVEAWKSEITDEEEEKLKSYCGNNLLKYYD